MPSPVASNGESTSLDPASLVGDVLAGRYELLEVVGVGGMSSVFAATDHVLERRVAVKLLHRRLAGEPAQVARFRREASTVAGLAHENIVSVLDRGEDRGVPFIVFEYVPGENLKELMRRTGPLPVGGALAIAIGMARALAFAHANGYVHRDVKPHNVLVTGAGSVKVTDFGIARSLDVGEGLTETGTVLGSADYIAPEQAQGRVVDESGDVYSLGVVLYELLTGELPFTGENFVAVAMKHVSEPAPRVRETRPDVPPRVDQAVATALVKDPSGRFVSMAQFERELEACREEAHGTASAPPETLVKAPAARPSAPARRSWRRLAVAAAVVVVAIGAAAAALLTPADHDRGSQTPPAHGAPPPVRPAAGGPVRLHAVAAYDPPPGDGVEDNSRLALATDGNATTAWATEWYASERFGNLKSGVGIVVDAGRPVRLTQMTVRTDTPGFTAIVKSGASPHGPFGAVSPQRTVEQSTTFALSSASPARYYLIWITSLSPETAPRFVADVNEVTASGG
jgi:serine/threonine-protein kinase